MKLIETKYNLIPVIAITGVRKAGKDLSIYTATVKVNASFTSEKECEDCFKAVKNYLRRDDGADLFVLHQQPGYAGAYE